MRIRNMIAKGFAVIAFAASLWGCSNANSSAPNVNASGQHPAGWYVDHRAAYLANPNQCYPCHGSDLLGGISKVSCSSDSFNGLPCHSTFPPSTTHPQGWRDPLQHGAKAKAQPGIFSGFASCQTCHGADFNGGIAGVSCFAPDRNGFSCHGVNAPHAAAPWRTSPSPTHTNTVNDMAGSNPAACALCHRSAAGTPGCFNNTLCHGVPAAGAGHTLPYAQPSLHGGAAMSNLTFCQSCHATPATSGAGSNPRFNVPHGRLVNGCEDCHVPFAAHPPVLQIPAVFGNITTFNPLGTPWYLHCETSPSGFDGCRLCHGATLGGGPNNASACTTCHRNRVPTTLLDCASCHGNPPNGTAYPNIAATHPSHASGTFALPLDCPECHLDRGSVTLDHYTRTQSWRAGATSVQTGAVNFGALARTDGASPVYNETSRQCTNAYCHGATLAAGGTNHSPIWGQANYLAAGCGTCHGFPPPSPHPAATATLCIGCHPHVNASGTGFTDRTKHVNGMVEFTSGGGGVAPHPIPVGTSFPGSVHMYAAGSAPFSSCVVTSCHTNSSANRGVYPAATAGTPPDCQGCHVKSGPIGNPTAGCYSCHGNGTSSGRPSGTAFPDISGRHNSNHGGFSCATCHGANGTGQTTHGSSGGTAHNGVNFPVVIQFTGEATGITFTRTTVGHGTCSGTCHGNGHSGDTW
jgi:predicted CxxxxCH...CXXCH cytochrome family protein